MDIYTIDVSSRMQQAQKNQKLVLTKKRKSVSSWKSCSRRKNELMKIKFRNFNIPEIHLVQFLTARNVVGAVLRKRELLGILHTFQNGTRVDKNW